MRITIDNQDGFGAVDYTGVVAPEGAITVQRALNAPSRCSAEIVIGARGLIAPVRRARVTVTTHSGNVLFTGYVATEPVRIWAGGASTGPLYRARISAVSDEWLLDQLGSGGNAYGTASLGLSGGSLLTTLVSRIPGVVAGSFPVNVGSGTAQLTGSFVPQPTDPWSKNAGLAASAAYAGYRAVNNSILAQPAGGVTHSVSDADGTLSIGELHLSSVRELANDVTLSGAEEPAAYVEEIFIGDGTTTVFPLREPAYRGAQRTLLLDSFNEASLDTSQWVINDPGSHVSLTTAGLTLSGGNGHDGQTVVAAVDSVEMGGSIVAQLSDVVFGAASDGMLAGFYEGTTVLANCFAGFRVRQNAGATVFVPVVNGGEVGTAFTPVTGHKYTLRVRLHCVEMQRVMQHYYCMADGVVEGFGSASGVMAPMDLVFEVVDAGSASNTPATVLYDSVGVGGTVSSSSAVCEFAVANSTQLYGSIGSVSVTRPGTLWVVSTLPSGALQTRLVGLAGQGADCAATYGTEAGVSGKVTFFSGRVPVAGERMSVYYRGTRRAVARLASSASVASETQPGQSGVSRWLGKVLAPVARSSVDCESAAQAVLTMSTSRAAAEGGTYAMANPAADIWPGDVLSITSDGVTSSLLVRRVAAKDWGAQPEVIAYELALANDWATEWEDGLGLRMSEEIASDVQLPQVALDAPSQVTANLQQLSVMSLSATLLQLDAGVAPPTGGGFEVRRRDWAFGVGVDAADLVLRSPVRTFSIPRAAQVEEYYVRMYDASTPPLYSRFSSAVFVNAPMS